MKFSSKKLRVVLLIVVIFNFYATSEAREVHVKYRSGDVDLREYRKLDATHSSFIEEIHYKSSEGDLLVNLKGTYYQYCDVPKKIAINWAGSRSLGKYFNNYIKGKYRC